MSGNQKFFLYTCSRTTPILNQQLKLKLKRQRWFSERAHARSTSSQIQNKRRDHRSASPERVEEVIHVGGTPQKPGGSASTSTQPPSSSQPSLQVPWSSVRVDEFTAWRTRITPDVERNSRERQRLSNMIHPFPDVRDALLSRARKENGSSLTREAIPTDHNEGQFGQPSTTGLPPARSSAEQIMGGGAPVGPARAVNRRKQYTPTQILAGRTQGNQKPLPCTTIPLTAHHQILLPVKIQQHIPQTSSIPNPPSASNHPTQVPGADMIPVPPFAQKHKQQDFIGPQNKPMSRHQKQKAARLRRELEMEQQEQRKREYAEQQQKKKAMEIQIQLARQKQLSDAGDSSNPLANLQQTIDMLPRSKPDQNLALQGSTPQVQRGGSNQQTPKSVQQTSPCHMQQQLPIGQLNLQQMLQVLPLNMPVVQQYLQIYQQQILQQALQPALQVQSAQQTMLQNLKELNRPLQGNSLPAVVQHPAIVQQVPSPVVEPVLVQKPTQVVQPDSNLLNMQLFQKLTTSNGEELLRHLEEQVRQQQELLNQRRQQQFEFVRQQITSLQDPNKPSTNLTPDASAALLKLCTEVQITGARINQDAQLDPIKHHQAKLREAAQLEQARLEKEAQEARLKQAIEAQIKHSQEWQSPLQLTQLNAAQRLLAQFTPEQLHQIQLPKNQQTQTQAVLSQLSPQATQFLAQYIQANIHQAQTIQISPNQAQPIQAQIHQAPLNQNQVDQAQLSEDDEIIEVQLSDNDEIIEVQLTEALPPAMPISDQVVTQSAPPTEISVTMDIQQNSTRSTPHTPRKSPNNSDLSSHIDKSMIASASTPSVQGPSSSATQTVVDPQPPATMPRKRARKQTLEDDAYHSPHLYNLLRDSPQPAPTPANDDTTSESSTSASACEPLADLIPQPTPEEELLPASSTPEKAPEMKRKRGRPCKKQKLGRPWKKTLEDQVDPQLKSPTPKKARNNEQQEKPNSVVEPHWEEEDDMTTEERDLLLAALPTGLQDQIELHKIKKRWIEDMEKNPTKAKKQEQNAKPSSSNSLPSDMEMDESEREARDALQMFNKASNGEASAVVEKKKRGRPKSTKTLVAELLEKKKQAENMTNPAVATDITISETPLSLKTSNSSLVPEPSHQETVKEPKIPIKPRIITKAALKYIPPKEDVPVIGDLEDSPRSLQKSSQQQSREDRIRKASESSEDPMSSQSKKSKQDKSDPPRPKDVNPLQAIFDELNLFSSMIFDAEQLDSSQLEKLDGVEKIIKVIHDFYNGMSQSWGQVDDSNGDIVKEPLNPNKADCKWFEWQKDIVEQAVRASKEHFVDEKLREMEKLSHGKHYLAYTPLWIAIIKVTDRLKEDNKIDLNPKVLLELKWKAIEERWRAHAASKRTYKKDRLDSAIAYWNETALNCISIYDKVQKEKANEEMWAEYCNLEHTFRVYSALIDVCTFATRLATILKNMLTISPFQMKDEKVQEALRYIEYTEYLLMMAETKAALLQAEDQTNENIVSRINLCSAYIEGDAMNVLKGKMKELIKENADTETFQMYEQLLEATADQFKLRLQEINEPALKELIPNEFWFHVVHEELVAGKITRREVPSFKSCHDMYDELAARFFNNGHRTIALSEMILNQELSLEGVWNITSHADQTKRAMKLKVRGMCEKLQLEGEQLEKKRESHMFDGVSKHKPDILTDIDLFGANDEEALEGIRKLIDEHGYVEIEGKQVKFEVGVHGMDRLPDMVMENMQEFRKKKREELVRRINHNASLRLESNELHWGTVAEQVENGLAGWQDWDAILSIAEMNRHLNSTKYEIYGLETYDKDLQKVKDLKKDWQEMLKDLPLLEPEEEVNKIINIVKALKQLYPLGKKVACLGKMEEMLNRHKMLKEEKKLKRRAEVDGVVYRLLSDEFLEASHNLQNYDGYKIDLVADEVAKFIKSKQKATEAVDEMAEDVAGTN